MKKKSIIILLLFLPTIIFAKSAPLSNKQNQLGKLSKDIKNLQKNLESTQHQREKILQTLKQTDLEIASTSKSLSSINNKIKIQTDELKELQEETQLKKEALAKQQDLLQQQLKNEYALGGNSDLKILLNQEDTARLSRIKSYCHYLNQARLAIVVKIEQLIKEIETNQQQILLRVDQLTKLKQAQQEKNTSYQQLKTQQHHVIDQLSKQITNNQQHLSQLISNKKALETVIQNLKLSASGFTDSHQPFSKERNRLHWPTIGTIVKRFGIPIGQSQLFYSGVLIKAKLGQAVYAVHGGRIVFANWLKGFGLLLIIEHDHGYMTLYAHNDNLYKKNGDTVKGGEMIASVGNSGGNVENGLYFEIRYKGKPQDPEKWLNKKT